MKIFDTIGAYVKRAIGYIIFLRFLPTQSEPEDVPDVPKVKPKPRKRRTRKKKKTSRATVKKTDTN